MNIFHNYDKDKSIIERKTKKESMPRSSSRTTTTRSSAPRTTRTTTIKTSAPKVSRTATTTKSSAPRTSKTTVTKTISPKVSKTITTKTTVPKVTKVTTIKTTVTIPKVTTVKTTTSAPRKSTVTRTSTVKVTSATPKKSIKSQKNNNNYNYGSNKESQGGEYLVSQFGGYYTKSPGSRTASDIQHHLHGTKLFDVQVKASRPSSKGSNKVSIAEKKGLCEISERDGSIPLCVEMKGNNAKFEILK